MLTSLEFDDTIKSAEKTILATTESSRAARKVGGTLYMRSQLCKISQLHNYLMFFTYFSNIFGGLCTVQVRVFAVVLLANFYSHLHVAFDPRSIDFLKLSNSQVEVKPFQQIQVPSKSDVFVNHYFFHSKSYCKFEDISCFSMNLVVFLLHSQCLTST